MNKNFRNIVLLIFMLIIIYVFIHNCSVHCFFGDDFDIGIYHRNQTLFDSLFNFTKGKHDGGALTSFITKLFSFTIPCLLIKLGLKIHPADFMCYGHGIVQAIISFIFISTFLKLIDYRKNSNLLYIVLFIFITSIFAIQTTSIAGYIYINNTIFYRYILSNLLFNVFILYLLKYNVNPIINNNSNILMRVRGGENTSFFIPCILYLYKFRNYIYYMLMPYGIYEFIQYMYKFNIKK